MFGVVLNPVYLNRVYRSVRHGWVVGPARKGGYCIGTIFWGEMWVSCSNNHIGNGKGMDKIPTASKTNHRPYRVWKTTVRAPERRQQSASKYDHSPLTKNAQEGRSFWMLGCGCDRRYTPPLRGQFECSNQFNRSTCCSHLYIANPRYRPRPSSLSLLQIIYNRHLSRPMRRETKKQLRSCRAHKATFCVRTPFNLASNTAYATHNGGGGGRAATPLKKHPTVNSLDKRTRRFGKANTHGRYNMILLYYV